MRLLPTVLALLSSLYASAQPANQGDVLQCRSMETGAEANSTLIRYGLAPANNPNLLVGFYCEPLAPAFSCILPFPSWLTCDYYCLCCREEEEIDIFPGFVCVDGYQVLVK